MKPNGDLHICLDPKDLNKVIIREHYKVPTLEEITHKLNKAKRLSKVDAYKGFFAYPMDYESSLKTTFKHNYLAEEDTDTSEFPMGAKFSQDAYQMKMDQILEGLKGVYCNS